MAPALDSDSRVVVGAHDATAERHLKWSGLHIDAFERLAIPALQDAIRSGRMVVIDEIGKMELASKRFCDLVEKTLESPALVLATIMERHHPFADQIKRRADVVIFELILDNRNDVPDKITAMIREQLERHH